jgi:Sulfotransferase domain
MARAVTGRPEPAKVETAHHLPTFIVIGAMKAGTTSLYQYLRHHDQIYMSRIKELDFFVAERNWSRGLEWYRRQFTGAGDALALGEASTLYTMRPEFEGVPERIARVLPDVRLIYVVRDPIARMRSHYQHRVMTGTETAAPEVALLEDRTYLACSRYAMQLERYLDHFPRERILLITSDALHDDRTATVQSVYRFLGVDADQVPDVIGTEFYRTAERRSYPPVVWWARRMAKKHLPPAKQVKELVDAMLARRAERARLVGVAGNGSGTGSDDDAVIPAELRERLADLLRDDVARLRAYLPPDFDGWGIA